MIVPVNDWDQDNIKIRVIENQTNKDNVETTTKSQLKLSQMQIWRLHLREL